MTPADLPSPISRLWSGAAPTPLRLLPKLAARCGVAHVYLKDESGRPLGSFKALGGVYAGLRALAQSAGVAAIEELLVRKEANRSLPPLVCASDGNHGLAVAAAAETAGSTARVYLHRHVPEARARKIAARGAEIVWIDGTYDDAVDAAFAAVERGEGVMVSDTSPGADDPVVADVLNGYGLMADEIDTQLRTHEPSAPDVLFIQAGVGGLAAALARGLREKHLQRCRIVVVEPERAACVGAALRSGRIERLRGDLQTAAEMLSCGEASAAALEILKRNEAVGMTVSEAEILNAVNVLAECDGPPTTPSGATGVAGLISAAANPDRVRDLDMHPRSRVLLIVSEGPV